MYLQINKIFTFGWATLYEPVFVYFLALQYSEYVLIARNEPFRAQSVGNKNSERLVGKIWYTFQHASQSEVSKFLWSTLIVFWKDSKLCAQSNFMNENFQFFMISKLNLISIAFKWFPKQHNFLSHPVISLMLYIHFTCRVSFVALCQPVSSIHVLCVCQFWIFNNNKQFFCVSIFSRYHLIDVNGRKRIIRKVENLIRSETIGRERERIENHISRDVRLSSSNVLFICHSISITHTYCTHVLGADLLYRLSLTGSPPTDSRSKLIISLSLSLSQAVNYTLQCVARGSQCKLLLCVYQLVMESV